jgi:hypothetical protein
VGKRQSRGFGKRSLRLCRTIDERSLGTEAQYKMGLLTLSHPDVIGRPVSEIDVAPNDRGKLMWYRAVADTELGASLERSEEQRGAAMESKYYVDGQVCSDVWAGSLCGCGGGGHADRRAVSARSRSSPWRFGQTQHGPDSCCVWEKLIGPDGFPPRPSGGLATPMYYPSEDKACRPCVCQAWWHYLRTMCLRGATRAVLPTVERVVTVAMGAAAQQGGTENVGGYPGLCLFFRG